jgi:acyl-CoA synthetase (AMP-forming)/AMP-acid ligase II
MGYLKEKMLYDQWRQIARANHDEIALWDLTSGESWSFRRLADLVERSSIDHSSPSFPEGVCVKFILKVLLAWRARQVVCPLEPGQIPPELNGHVPAGIVHLKTTSASTGTPRLVAFTAEQLIADANNIVATMGLCPEWPNLGVISLAHSYGFSNLVLPLLLHGIPLILSGTPLPEALRRAAAVSDELTLAAVPALWRTWHDGHAIPSNVRLAISAGAPLPVGLEQGVYASCGIKIHNFYGSSECGGIAFDSSPEPRSDGSCAGSSLNNVDVSVASDGCLEVRGAAVAQSYWPKHSPNLANGVFHTSDVSEISNGLVFLRGRATDQINVAGRKVLPETIEKALAAHPRVRKCLAFGVPSADAQRGETIVACVVGDGDVTNESLRQFAMANLPAWQVPRDWWLVNSLEVNGRGKLSRAEWRRRYLELTFK